MRRPLSLRNRWVPAAALLGALLLSACEPEVKAKPQLVAFRAEGAGVPLAGVALSAGDRELGKTDASGVLRAELEGDRGKLVTVKVRCPEGYRGDSEPLKVKLAEFRAVGKERPALEHTVRCIRDQRQLAVVVITDRRANLPVIVDAEPAARTDAHGVAHLLLEREPGASIRLQLDTSDTPGLSPRQPARLVRVDGQDDFFVFEQSFEEPAAPKPRVRRAAPKKSIPYRLQ